ncbi:MAG: hypothetical protein AAF281_12060, partial [Pseudomonadota bacterium]
WGWLGRLGVGAVAVGPLDTDGAPGLARFKLGAGARPLLFGATRISAPGTALAARLTARPPATGHRAEIA